MNQKNQVIKTLEVIEKYFNKKSLTEKDLLLLINDVHYSIIEDYRKKFIKSTTKLTFEDYEDFSDVIIDLANILIVSVLRTHSLDTTSSPYELPEEKNRKLKKYLSRRLMSKKDDSVGNELYSCLFTFSYMSSIKNAVQHRKLVLSEKKNRTIKK